MNLFKISWNDSGVTYSKIIESTDLTTAITLAKNDSFSKSCKLLAIEQIFVTPRYNDRQGCRGGNIHGRT